MIIGLHDSEKEHFKKAKTFPNYALMKISAYHKAKGDTVEWWDQAKVYDRVYSSKIFDFTEENKDLPPDTIKGGTGYDIESKLPQEIDDIYPDYSIYPDCDYAIGYITRGCPRKCPWCYVPKKEGNIKPYRKWTQLVRLDVPNLILMDNNILACRFGIEQLKDMIGKGWRIDLNQGMDARLVTEEVADILAALDWIKWIRFSCDTIGQIESIDRVAEMLGSRGIKPYRIFVYVLVRKDLDEADYRVQRLKRHKGIHLYAQAERNADTICKNGSFYYMHRLEFLISVVMKARKNPLNSMKRNRGIWLFWEQWQRNQGCVRANGRRAVAMLLN